MKQNLQVTQYPPLYLKDTRKHIYVCILSLWAVARSKTISPAHHLFSIPIFYDMTASLAHPHLLSLEMVGNRMGFISVLEHCSWLLYMWVVQTHLRLFLLATVAPPALFPSSKTCSFSASFTTHGEAKEIAFQLISQTIHRTLEDGLATLNILFYTFHSSLFFYLIVIDTITYKKFT